MKQVTSRFSNRDRVSRIAEASSQSYDLIIIGGGITGAGIALDAALRGLKTILIEKNDFASGTSSKSTKLIHGGLRYLKQLEIGLVRETGLERAIAHNNACHLVHPEKMLLPIVNNGTFSKLTAGIAVSVYDWLASVPKAQQRKMLSKEETLKREPLLRQENLKSGIMYSEYRTDDARLTIELIKDARRNSAEAFNYLEVRSFVEENKVVKGVLAYDKILSKEVAINGKVVVNATGPWADMLRQMEDASTQTNLRLTKGVHIVVNKKKFKLNNSTYFDAFDGRMIFAIPRGNCVYIGTTDTDYSGNKDELHCNLEDADYLLQAVNTFFDISTLTIDDIDSTWAGLRPLIQQAGKAPGELSRRDEIFISESKLITITGGKLTGFRKMAERILRLVYEQLEIDEVPSKTKDHKISKDPFENYEEYNAYASNIINRYSKFKLSDGLIADSVANFGKEVSSILEKADMRLDGGTEENERKFVKTMLNYTLDFEACYHTLDFIERRCGWLYFNIEEARRHTTLATNHIKSALNLSDERTAEMLERSLKAIKDHSLEKLKHPQPGVSQL